MTTMALKTQTQIQTSKTQNSTLNLKLEVKTLFFER